MMGGIGYGGWGMMGPFGWIGGLLLLVLVVLAIVWLWRALDLGTSVTPGTGSGPRSGGSDRATEVARERYARGEIDAEEFERIERALSA